MLQAAYYIGLGCRVVLCLQMLPPKCTIAGEEVSSLGFHSVCCVHCSHPDVGSTLSAVSTVPILMWVPLCLLCPLFHPDVGSTLSAVSTVPS